MSVQYQLVVTFHDAKGHRQQRFNYDSLSSLLIHRDQLALNLSAKRIETWARLEAWERTHMTLGKGTKR